MTARSVEKLAWRHPLQPNEGSVGFASRLAALNGRTLAELLRDQGIRPYALDRGDHASIIRLARVGGADAAMLERYSPAGATDSRHQILGGEALYRLSVRKTYFSYCPACLDEDQDRFDGPPTARPWLRMEWTVTHFRSCRRHNVTLSKAEPVRTRFEPPDFCRTMAFRDPSDEATAAAPSSPFQDWLFARLSGARDGGNWLDDMQLYVSIAFCEALGLSALHSPKVRTARLDALEWAEAADAGFDIARRGAGAIEDLLERLNAAQTRTRGVWAPRDTFGYAWGVLEKTLADPAWMKPRDLFASYAMQALPLESGTLVLGHEMSERKVHTIRTAARASGAHARTMRRLFKRKGISAEQVEAGLRDHRVTAVSDELASIVTKLKGALTTPNVQKLTGIPLPWLRAIIAEGHLPTVTGSQEKEYAKHRFERSAVDAMLKRLLEGAVEVIKPTEDQVGLIEARSRAVGSTERVLRIAFGNELRWKGCLAGRSGFHALLVDVNEVTTLVRSEAPKHGLSKTEIMDFITGMGRDSVTRFIEFGQLELVDEFSPAARRLVKVISRESAERFRVKYVALGELCQRHELHHKQVRLLLGVHGIEELFEPGRYKAFFYDRAAVEAAERADPGFWRYDKAKAHQARSRNAA
jgi:hypothetical protein